MAHPSGSSALIFAAVVAAKLIPEARLLKPAADDETPWTPDTHSARLQRGPLGLFLHARFTFAFLAIFLGLTYSWWTLPILLLAELLERQLFFQSVHAPKMPGNFGPR
jgi:hypothetical protein